MNTEEVAKKVVELTRKQAWKEAIDTLYDKDIVSVEARTMDGSSPESRGIEAVRGKTDWWENNMQVHSAKVSGPFVALEEANADVGSWSLHSQRRQDCARRVFADGRVKD